MKKHQQVLKNIFQPSLKQESLDDLLLMSEHCNGYKREYAVRCLGELKNPIAIPALIIRTNDWVPQVRNAAIDAIQNLLTNNNAEAFILNLPDLYHLYHCERGDHTGLIAKVINFLIQADNAAYLKCSITNKNAHVARISVKLCIKYALINKEDLLSRCLSHHDVVIRVIASNILATYTGAALELFLQQAIQDPFMPVRREAFYIYLRLMPEKGLKIAHLFLFDKHSSIRQIAIKQLLKNNIDIESIITPVLLSDAQSALKIRCSLLVLAELRSTQSISLIKSFATHPLPGIKKASLQALTKLSSDEAQSLLFNGLKDKSPAVAKESSRLINKYKIYVPISGLLEIIKYIHYPHTLTVCLSSAKRVNKWDRLLFLLNLFKQLSTKDNTRLEIISNELGQWNVDFNRSSSQVSCFQIQQIKVIFNRYKRQMSKDLSTSLAFTIKVSDIND